MKLKEVLDFTLERDNGKPYKIGVVSHKGGTGKTMLTYLIRLRLRKLGIGYALRMVILKDHLRSL